jgi:5-methyltetrahydropteroyltriglutamate--homocysteine methyltransferase
MKRSIDRILTTHVGSLPRPPELIVLLRSIERGQPFDQKAYGELVPNAVKDIVRKQVEAGVDVVSDGEVGKPGFINYVNARLGGFEPSKGPAKKAQWGGTRETNAFPEFYQWIAGTAGGGAAADNRQRMVCTGPITYKGQDLVGADIANMKAALAGMKVEEVFLPSISPSNVAAFQHNEYYKSDEEYLFAIADAMREEYKAIVAAGFLVQIDDPALLVQYLRNPGMSMDDWRRWAQVHVESINFALRGIPAEKVRHHTCHGINMGPRVNDMELKDHVEFMLKINAGGYSFEAANPRHEHEWRVWKTVKLPEGKVILPGVITQSSFLIEHPELVAERIERFASVVGRENVIASSDCGFATQATSEEIHPSITWAKLKALAEGAALASGRLWVKSPQRRTGS